MIVALALVAAIGASDPLPAIAGRVAIGDRQVALELTREALAGFAGRPPQGLRYLEGRLAAECGDPVAARTALLRSIAEEPLLAPWAREEIAELALAAGDAEAAARDLLVVAATAPERRLRDRAHAALRRSAERGGGCRPLLAASAASRSAMPTRFDARRLDLLAADCELAAGRIDEAGGRWRALLAERNDDLVAQEIVDRIARRELAGLPGPSLPDSLLGKAFARQRDFARAIPLLELAVAGAASTSDGELALILGRSRFWSGDAGGAGDSLERLAAVATSPALRAEAYFYAARSRELGKDPEAALADYRRAEAATPRGGWVDAARLGIVRLESRAGREVPALSALARMGSGASAASARARALLFLAVSDILAGRGDRAGAWLARARQGGQVQESEIAFWQGRTAELLGRPGEAEASYRSAIGDRPHRPFARSAAKRLRSPELAPLARRTLERLVRGPLQDRLAASTLRRALDLPDPAAEAALSTAVAEDTRLGAFSRLAPAAPETWPLWRLPRIDAGILLLRLGLWREGATAARQRFAFPPPVALAGAEALAAAGEAGAALRLAEGVAAAAPRGLPESHWSPDLRRLLFAIPFRDQILEAAALHRVDPALLVAILREESAFEPTAYSPAAARGLGQFVLPTARALGPAIGQPVLSASDLDRPEIAIPLAAAHLAELGRRFGGRPEVVVAAYNAGEAQAEAWLGLCTSAEPEEFLSKVAFRETRAYLGRVLESRERIRTGPSWQAVVPP